MNPEIWRVCAGISAAGIPKLDSRVYYFPQGHADHSCLNPTQPSHHLRHQSRIVCHVSAVHLLADSETDEVFAKLLLIPGAEHVPQEDISNNNSGDGRIMSFSKILTPSDANYGGGFSIPRNCALSIFPALNLEEDKPTQFLGITDVHGKEWKLCHVYRGSPKRHLFTTGWSKFVDEKQLVAGDTIIFMKNSSGKLFVGIRRNRKMATTTQKKQMEVTEKSLAEAVDKVARNMEFEVVYYPKPREWDFVVDAKIVDEAMKIGWVCGMRVKIAVEREDSSKTASYEGTVTSIYGSHWRMLQVEWDEPNDLKSAERVSPWEVELVPSILGLPFLPTKKLKVDHHRERGNSCWNQTLLSYDTSLVGIQGARHDFSSSLVINDPTNGPLASSSRNSSMQYGVFSPDYSHIRNIASSSRNSSLQRLTTVPTISSPQSGVFFPYHRHSSNIASSSKNSPMRGLPTKVPRASSQSGVLSPYHSNSSNIASSSRNSSMQGLTTAPTNVTLASSQSGVFSPYYSDSSNRASSSRNSSMQGSTAVPTKVTLASSQSGVFSPDNSDSSNIASSSRNRSTTLFGTTMSPGDLNSSRNTAEVVRNSIRLFGNTIYIDNPDSHDSGFGRQWRSV